MNEFKIQLNDILNQKNILEELPLSIFIKDRTGHYLFVNQKFQKVLKVDSSEALLNKTDFEIIDYDTATIFTLIDESVLSGKKYSTSYPLSIDKNKVDHVSTTKIPLYEDEAIVGILGMFFDFDSEEMSVFNHFKDSEASLRESIFNGFNGAIFVTDIASNKLIRANDFGHNLLNQSNNEDTYKLIQDKSWCTNNYNNSVNSTNAIYFESIDKYLTLTIQVVEWEGIDANIRYIIDVTKIIKGEKNNQLTLKQLDKALNHLRLIYFEYILGDNLLHINPIGCDALGVEDTISNYPEYFISHGLVHPDYQDLYSSSFLKIKSGEVDYINCEVIMNLKGVGYTWRDVKISTIYDDDGKRIKLVITISDLNRYKKLEQRFGTILRNNDIDTWEYDLNTNEILIFDDPAAITGNVTRYSLMDTTKKINPDDVENYLNMFKTIRNGAYQASSEYRVNSKGKIHNWYHSELTKLINAKGVAKTAIGSSRNISNYKEAEERYQEELTFQNLRNTNQLLYAFVNLETLEVQTFYSSNKDLKKIAKDEIINKFFHYIVGHRQKVEYYKYLKDELIDKYKKGIYTSQRIIKFKSIDKTITVKLQIRVIENPNTKELMCFATGEDVDIEVKTEELLKASAAQKYELFSRIDFANDEVLTFKNKSDTFKLPLGVHVLSVDDAISTLWKQFLQNIYDKDSLENYFKKQLNGNDSVYKIYRIKDDKGVEYVKRSRLVVLDEIGRVYGDFWDDITDIEIQNEVRNKELAYALNLAKSANASKTKFLSSMSHDIRTPLNAIIGMNELALEDINDKEQLIESLTIIKNSSAHLLDLINNILDMSRIESSKIVYNVTLQNINNVMKALISRLKPIYYKKKQNIVLTMNIKKFFVYIDKPVFNRVLENIITNSIKFSPNNSTITINLYDHFDTEANRIIYYIEVQDQGIGMSEDELENVFNPFFRSNNKLVNNVEGTGLGLAIAKRHIDEIGGSIKIESVQGHGTKTIISAPLRANNRCNIKLIDKNINKNDFRNIRLESKTVLLVEDNKINMLLANKLISKLGISIVEAYNGQEGLDLFKNSATDKFDAIITDIQMPYMDGLEMSRQIRALEKIGAKSIPIIAMTANAFLTDIRNCYNAGMNSHIAKPINNSELVNTLIKYLK
ncbi:MAG: response regulator [Spirochaetaceae bacterium]|nr:response regulator [Spirochaetaceae bacterium]